MHMDSEYHIRWEGGGKKKEQVWLVRLYATLMFDGLHDIFQLEWLTQRNSLKQNFEIR